jgi:hypothetical protein
MTPKPSVWLKAYPAKEAGAGCATGPDDVAHADGGCRTPREHWGSVDVSIRRAAGAKVPIELLGLLKGRESGCEGYGGAHARYRHAARYVARHSRPARSPIFIRRDLRPGQTGNPSLLPSATTSSPARPKKKCGRRDVSRSEILRA